MTTGKHRSRWSYTFQYSFSVAWSDRDTRPVQLASVAIPVLSIQGNRCERRAEASHAGVCRGVFGRRTDVSTGRGKADGNGRRAIPRRLQPPGNHLLSGRWRFGGRRGSASPASDSREIFARERGSRGTAKSTKRAHVPRFHPRDDGRWLRGILRANHWSPGDLFRTPRRIAHRAFSAGAHGVSATHRGMHPVLVDEL